MSKVIQPGDTYIDRTNDALITVQDVSDDAVVTKTVYSRERFEKRIAAAHLISITDLATALESATTAIGQAFADIAEEFSTALSTAVPTLSSNTSRTGTCDHDDCTDPLPTHPYTVADTNEEFCSKPCKDKFVNERNRRLSP